MALVIPDVVERAMRFSGLRLEPVRPDPEDETISEWTAICEQKAKPIPGLEMVTSGFIDPVVGKGPTPESALDNLAEKLAGAA